MPSQVGCGPHALPFPVHPRGDRDEAPKKAAAILDMQGDQALAFVSYALDDRIRIIEPVKSEIGIRDDLIFEIGQGDRLEARTYSDSST